MDGFQTAITVAFFACVVLALVAAAPLIALLIALVRAVATL